MKELGVNYYFILPASSVRTLKISVYGPIPALFSAVSTNVYVVNGIKMIVVLVMFEKC